MVRQKSNLPKGRPPKNYARPRWMKIVRVIGLVIAYIVIIIAIIGMVISIYKSYKK
ncbi:hypothetical protein [Mucilaginibacter sp. L3T2-6]|uniref:hypothetical protein n=1 Tax=Mucilaginibacter sp. L3T2-6 TaxID=3062491 RepID=UPI002677591A|nr:hypothetical protein [Mucilaginibacter sp. L3T2-6]MDO3641488.1 hypothetical protein [Mucilaginibacter sp. L3T2-6]MDV6213751.1 hypothetical protein [Mucilaginibacter sp. L3T2-6]